MDFTLSLTHFCEVHGPKSVLCTQVLPLVCAKCSEPPSPIQSRASGDSHTPRIHQKDDPGLDQAAPHLNRTDRDFPRPPATVERPNSGTIEQHPYYRRADSSRDDSRYPYARAQGDTCASCTFTVPTKVAAQLPDGAPGSLSKDGGKPKHGAPVLRSREFICLGKDKPRRAQGQPSSSHESQASSTASMDSVISHTNCHDHTVTYLTAKSPDSAENYANMRASVIKALSCEVLPRGMSEGPLCFGDSTSGYTIAHVFRLTDPKARGRRRAYAFVALAGKDTYRAFKACPMLWDAFAIMAQAIEQKAQQSQEAEELRMQKERDDRLSASDKVGHTEVTSFLTQRPRDADGQPRRAGQTQPRSLAEITGYETIFTDIHGYFVHVLRCLGDKFGGLPLAESNPMAYQTTATEQGVDDEKFPAHMSSEVLAALSFEHEPESPNTLKGSSDGDKPSKRSSMQGAERESTSNMSTSMICSAATNPTSTAGSTPTQTQSQLAHRHSQCAPLGVDLLRQRQVTA